MQNNDVILITDVGSTTTKAILIDQGEARLLGIEHADTTVEEPFNDVAYGVYNATKAVEKSCNVSLLAADASPQQLSFNPQVKYFSTSSAGGGLQILVIGLTLFDSASSAKRAAYGAGGVILDVFAMDDKRSTLEQMLSMRNLRPDMILLSGGTDGGAIGSVLRLAEILRIAKPLPKFSTSSKIPTLYAGNQDVADLIKRMISSDFDLYILPNLRPDLDRENLKPTQEKIQELFMENVMERAPGYSQLKKVVHSPILPTPAGVLKSLLQLGKDKKKNLIAFDIGGATTDVFTHINGHYQRTVSANLGMSYSALNVLKESGIDEIKALLPDSISAAEIRNYAGNKTLYPTLNPQSKNEYRIEHALAKCAIKLSLIQHQQMHYNTQKIGYLDALKSNGQDKYEEKFEYIVNEEKHYFYPRDIDLVIGAGGIFAHAQNPRQCMDILISGFKPTGISEFAIDRHFISPHLGVLLSSNEALATQLLHSECLQFLALYIRPFFPNKKDITVLEANLEDNQKMAVLSDAFYYLPARPNQTIELKASKKCSINAEDMHKTISTDLPIIIDTRLERDKYSLNTETALDLYPADAEALSFGNRNQAKKGIYTRVVELPYNGVILKSENERVSPEDVVASNPYNPPRLYVINTCSAYQDAPEELIRNNLQVAAGDIIDFNQILLNALPGGRYKAPFRSPVRGKVEFIDYHNGMIVASEIQDYSSKPVKVDLSSQMAIPAKKIKWYLKKNVGDFVYQGDMLAQKMASSGMAMAQSPTTGEVVDYDKNTAVMTIHYKAKPHNYLAHVTGIISRVMEKKAVEIRYHATRLEASIGWGNPNHGKLLWIPERSNQTLAPDSIVALGYQPDLNELKSLFSAGVKGIIVASVTESDVVELLGNEQGVINTGFEPIPAPLVLVQGFGKLELSAQQKAYFEQHLGKECLLEAHTRIRAGVLRPSINVIEPE